MVSFTAFSQEKQTAAVKTPASVPVAADSISGNKKYVVDVPKKKKNRTRHKKECSRVKS